MLFQIMVLKISAEQARQFLVRRHMLAPARSLRAKTSSVLEVIEHLGSLQFDPLETPGARNHDLVLHARISGYKRGWCEKYLYATKNQRKLFEAYNKSLNILPVQNIAYHRVTWQRATERYQERIYQNHENDVEQILAWLTELGPMSSSEIGSRIEGQVDWHWARTAKGRAILEALFESGKIALSRREGNKRYFDLTERLFKQEHLTLRVSEDQASEHRLMTRFQGIGLMGSSASPEIVTGIASSTERKRMLANLLRRGQLLEVHVTGLKGARYILPHEKPLLDDAPLSKTVSFIAPLDPLIWDRRLLSELFHFEYIWEVYTPEKKRRWGYYVLPILFGDQFVGRIEPVFDKTTKTLSIQRLLFEKDFEPSKAEGFQEAFVNAVNDYATFVGSESLTLPASKSLSKQAKKAVSWLTE